MLEPDYEDLKNKGILWSATMIEQLVSLYMKENLTLEIIKERRGLGPDKTDCMNIKIKLKGVLITEDTVYL